MSWPPAFWPLSLCFSGSYSSVVSEIGIQTINGNSAAKAERDIELHPGNSLENCFLPKPQISRSDLA